MADQRPSTGLTDPATSIDRAPGCPVAQAGCSPLLTGTARSSRPAPACHVVAPPTSPGPTLPRAPDPSPFEASDDHAHREHRAANHPDQQRNFGRIHDVFPVPDLTEIQTRSYERFLQADIPAEQREDAGLEGVFREIFPIESYDKTLKLEYIKFDLGKPRYEPDECRQLRLTYGRPLHVWLRLNKGETAIEESVYLGDMPIMIGGGEFIINGAERVVVSQLHRSPGVDFVVEIEAGDRKLHACRVIPERGSWIELQVTKKDTLGVRIDQSGKFSSMTLLRAMSPQFSSDEAILTAFYETEDDRHRRSQGAARSSKGGSPAATSSTRSTGEVLIESGATISKTSAQVLADANLGNITVLKDAKDPLDPPVAPGRPDHRPRERPAADLPAAPAGQPAAAGEGHASCSTRSSSTPTATASARSAGSGSTASSTRRSPTTR